MKITITVSALALPLALGCTGLVQAQGSITMFGLVDSGLAWESVRGNWNGAPYKSKSFTVVEGGTSGSRLGFKMKEDLGGGVAAIIQLENGFDVTGSRIKQGGRLFGRQATIGLTSKTLGTLELGRQKNLASQYRNPITNTLKSIYSQLGVGSSFSSINTVRYDNLALYRSPVFAGLQFGIGYSTAIDGQKTWQGKALTTGIHYHRGPWAAFVGYDEIEPERDDTRIKALVAGVAHDFGKVTISAALGQTKNGWFASRSFGQLQTGSFIAADGFSLNSWFLGMSAPLGNGVFQASWQVADPVRGATKGSKPFLVGDALKEQQIFSTGYTHNLSKRSSLYAYGSLANNALFQKDLKSKLLIFGIQHKF